MEYNNNYLPQQHAMFYEQQVVVDAFVPYTEESTKMMLLSINSSSSSNSSIVITPESPDSFQYDDTTPHCTSPSSMLSNTSLNFSIQPSFPITPTSSPYQHASDVAMSLLATRSSNNNTVFTIPSTDDQQPPRPSPKQQPTEPHENARKNSELRRQIHIQSEQKRRAQIKDGFEDLRNELPSYLNKKMSKVALLHRTVPHIPHLKHTQMTILAELKRLADENEQLKKFQQDVLLHKQMYNL
jgi:hypothetical protein